VHLDDGHVCEVADVGDAHVHGKLRATRKGRVRG
jgi:hypothetical protein